MLEELLQEEIIDLIEEARKTERTELEDIDKTAEKRQVFMPQPGQCSYIQLIPFI